ncbi:MAG: hypothetical protein JOZ01_07115 [Candidatus Eremiobacteraeota bacterium]|nr:hypothetical protein [Candidatus Eremiobacteraeota bacterium]
MANEFKKTVDDIGDRLKEGVHRTNADVEHDTRAAAGDEMTPGEKARSVGREVSEELKADADKVKRSARDLT